VSEHENTARNRIHVFLDFWNFQLSLNERSSNMVKLDWMALPVWLADKADAVLVNAGEPRGHYVGGNVYISYDPWKTNDKKLIHWVNNVVAHAPGVQVVSKKRKPKSPPVCPSCHKEIAVCPHCGEPIRRMGEKGIDTGLVTDLIRLAWDDAYDTAVLVSADADFIPAVRFVQEKGKRVIHACFPPSGSELQRVCWGSVNLASLLNQMPTRS